MTDAPKFDYTYALPTFYRGRHYRSRLEARWAVFFEYMGIEYLYEPEGFALPSGDRYQPDFFLPGVYLRRGSPGVYIEVKPSYEAVHASFSTLSEFGSGHRDFKYPPGSNPFVDDPHPGEHNLVVLVGNVSSKAGVGELGHYQFGPWWDDNMGFQYCTECHGLKIDFVGGNYDECPRCGSKGYSTAYHADFKAAEQAALAMRFDRQGRAQT